MSWKVVERKIGQAGNLKQRQKRQSEWDRKYDENWMIGYMIDGDFISQEDALESIYYESYKLHFDNHPKDLDEMNYPDPEGTGYHRLLKINQNNFS